MTAPSASYISETVRLALVEDVADGDLTAQLIPEEQQGRARIITREGAVICGAPWVSEVFRQLDERVRIDWKVADGARTQANQVLCTIEGPARAMLTGERTALNFLQSLSGTATAASTYVAAVAGTGCRILDTRKTIPGLRLAQKYAVRCGGGTNHRIGLFDAILVKENHIAAAGSIDAAVRAARNAPRKVMIEVEVESFDQLKQALDCGADRILLDNFSNEHMREAVRIARAHPHRAELEASGNISLDTLRAVAETGVDFISVGALTKHVRAVDLSMRFE